MRKGWTLVELLVVVAIISVLTALMVSTFANAKKQAQRVACRVAVKSYVVEIMEHNGRFLIVIPQEANCHECHRPRYNAGPLLQN
jgi:prepilin-type N-terminal cleavage/methylation domain-containing protein